MAVGVDVTVKKFFFDRALVASLIGKENVKALSKIGAFVRRRARSSMRRRKRASAAGLPPSAHSSDPVRSLKNIWFAFDPARQSVVIGPLRLHGSQGSIPALHEYGGTRPVVEVRLRGRWVPAATISSRALLQRLPRRVRQATYPARPYMGPALLAEIPNFPSLWATNREGAA